MYLNSGPGLRPGAAGNQQEKLKWYETPASSGPGFRHGAAENLPGKIEMPYLRKLLPFHV